MIVQRWQCDECGELYDSADEARACHPGITVGYQCEECEAFYEGWSGEDAAKDCTHDRKPGDAVA